MSHTSDGVATEVVDGVAHLRLDRPERRNTITGPVAEALLEGVRSTRERSRVLLLSGAGDHLCAGLDIDAFGADPAPPWRAAFSQRWRELHVALWDDDRPLVVAHRGAAVGAGSALLFAGDVVVSGRHAFAHVIETALGMVAPINLAWMAVRHSPALAAQFGLLAERVPAERLHQLGLVTEVVDDDRSDAVLDRALDRARRLAGFSADAVAGTRRAVRSLSGADFDAAIVEAQSHSEGLGGPRRLGS